MSASSTGALLHVGGTVSGLWDDHSALSSVGVTTRSSGVLELDKDKLKSTLNLDVTVVAELLIANTDSGTVGVAKLIQDITQNYTDFVDGY